MIKQAHFGLTEIFESVENPSRLEIPLFFVPVPAGFPSPADDYLEGKLDLNEYLIKHPSATFFYRSWGISMIKAGINHGDILIVDRSLEAKDKSVVVAMINKEFTIKRLRKINGTIYLAAENDDFDPIEITPEMEFQICGVVTHNIHTVK